jgi:hypothetical protein
MKVFSLLGKAIRLGKPLLGSAVSQGVKDALLKSAAKPISKQGISAGARAVEKHAGRANSVWKKLTGNAAEKNQQALEQISRVLEDPNSTYRFVQHKVHGKCLEIRGHAEASAIIAREILWEY